jgi:hypothetical protein
MQLFKVLALFVGAAAAAPALEERNSPSYNGPSGHEVEIHGIAYAGSGCPAGTVAGQLSSDLTTLTLLYDSFVAEAGKGIPPSHRRKNCHLNVKLKYPHGWQFSIFKADYRGYAYIPQGATGTCKATYYFSGSSQQISSTKKIYGPYDNNYLKTDKFGLTSLVWSPCGVEGLLNINSEVRLTPFYSKKPALMTVDSTDLKFHQLYYLQWKKC